jgi:hypothetical protein
MRVVVHFKTSEERRNEKKIQKIQKVQKKKKNKKLQHIVFPCGPPP